MDLDEMEEEKRLVNTLKALPDLLSWEPGVNWHLRGDELAKTINTSNPKALIFEGGGIFG